MGQLRLTQFKALANTLSIKAARTGSILILCFMISAFNYAVTQCLPQPGSIEGSVLIDQNFNGLKDASDAGIGQIKVQAYNGAGVLVFETLTNAQGWYRISGLSDQGYYRIEVLKPIHFEWATFGKDYTSDPAFIKAPSCNINFAFTKPFDFIGSGVPEIAVTCFAYGGLGVNPNLQTVVSTPYKFNGSSPIKKLGMKSATGSIWGLAYKRSTAELFSSSFVKSGAGLGPLGLGGLYKTNYTLQLTESFYNLADAGINTGNTLGVLETDCDYADFVGKLGLGDMDISADEKYLYVTNLFQKSIVFIPTKNPEPSKIIEIKIPDPGCNNADYAVSAIKEKDGKLYIGVTCTAEGSENEIDFYFHIYEMDLLSRTFNLILSTDFGRAYWLTHPADNHKLVSQWLTDIDFSDAGHMILAIADRNGHSFCQPGSYLTNQFGDILMAWKDNGVWKLENKAKVGLFTGSGLNNIEGPGGGEFFGEDYWVVGPSLHPEVSMGGVAVLPGSGEVVSVVFDPVYESLAGGLHKYSTTNGKKLAAIQIYNRTSSAFGKASGLGDPEIISAAAPIEIGNYVWLDLNKNGFQDADEVGLAQVKISLFNAKCVKIAETFTNAQGYYSFNSLQILDLQFDSQYYLVIDDARFNKSTHSLIIGADSLELTIPNQQYSGLYKDHIDNDAIIWSLATCNYFAQSPVISIVTGSAGQNNYTFDIGFIQKEIIIAPPPPPPPALEIYDLALIKKWNDAFPKKKGELMQFEIIIENQGNMPVEYVEIADYIPSTLVFNQAANPNWVLNGNIARYVINETISPFQRKSIFINLSYNMEQGVLV
ncbi:MAG: hypothetical protein M3Q56_04595 [Bacteroidota bacterium]|nr:hypothetical protein [Bacteroidota bacterium]